MAWPIQTPTLGSRLQALFRLQGRVRPRLDETIIPVVLTGDVQFPTDPEYQRLASAYGVGTQQSSFLSYRELRNPPLSGVLAVVDSITILNDNTTTGSAVQVVSRVNANASFSLAGVWRDLRLTGSSKVGTSPGADGSVLALPILEIAHLDALSIVKVETNIVVPPGEMIVTQFTELTNWAIGVLYQYREIDL